MVQIARSALLHQMFFDGANEMFSVLYDDVLHKSIITGTRLFSWKYKSMALR